MAISKAKSTTNLEKPGAGLPLIERFLAGYLLKIKAKTNSKEAISERFAAEADRIIELVMPLSETEGQKVVLIDRIQGIEDSSRNWSAYMVLEHLVIVNKGLGSIIETLSLNKISELVVKIEDVKPNPQTNREIIETFSRVVDLYVSKMSDFQIQDLRSKHTHPWFGPLSAQQWHCLAAMHHKVHRRQLEKIIARL